MVLKHVHCKTFLLCITHILWYVCKYSSSNILKIHYARSSIKNVGNYIKENYKSDRQTTHINHQGPKTE